MNIPAQKKTIILIGGGHSHTLFLQQWAQRPVAGVQLIIFDTQPHVTYTGMLPGFIAGHYNKSDLSIDIEVLAVTAGAHFHQAAIIQLDVQNQTVTASGGEVYSYDTLSIDIGIHSSTASLPISDPTDVVKVKPLTEFANRWQEFVSSTAMSETPVSIAVIGGGVAGVELALAIDYRLRTDTHRTAHINIIETHNLLAQVGSATKKYLLSQLKARDITIHTGVTVEKITPTSVTLSDQSIISSDFTVAATGPHPYRWVSETQLPCTNGYIQIDATLRSPTYPNVFAVGDCAHFLPYPLPKAGVYAVREAPFLYTNICALIQGKPLRTFTPQKDYLKLITLGNKRAAADKWGWCLHGAWLWQLKHYIDTSFMRRLRK